METLMISHILKMPYPSSIPYNWLQAKGIFKNTEKAGKRVFIQEIEKDKFYTHSFHFWMIVVPQLPQSGLDLSEKLGLFKNN